MQYIVLKIFKYSSKQAIAEVLIPPPIVFRRLLLSFTEDCFRCLIITQLLNNINLFSSNRGMRINPQKKFFVIFAVKYYP